MDYSDMTGEKNFKAGFSVDEITLDGDLGRFYLRPKDAAKDKETGKWPKLDLNAGVKLQFDADTGEKKILEVKPLKVVFLKIRRRLSYFSPALYLNTNEHNTKSDFVVVHGTNPKVSGIASDVWARLQQEGKTLKTQQLVYCYSPETNTVIRLVVKGSSLMSQEKNDDVLKFYDYLKSFTGDDHFYQFETKLVPVAEQGPKGQYFAMTFERGERLSPEIQENVNKAIEDTHRSIVAVDDAFNSRRESYERDSEVTPTDDLEQYFNTEDEINPEDIPF